jgi:hypothetical protein
LRGFAGELVLGRFHSDQADKCLHEPALRTMFLLQPRAHGEPAGIAQFTPESTLACTLSNLIEDEEWKAFVSSFALLD